jgi:beta-glucosidase/6-phospho-beta-glucosidase/beta-galactosidase
MTTFMFATGVENSAPIVAGGKRLDEFEKCGHYRRWRDDFDCVQEIGLTFLRYGPNLFNTFTGPDRFDWAFADETLRDLKRRRIHVIADLCHFGVPDWIGDFQNPDFPKLFAVYARAFAERYPWIQLYTPVNEMYVCARHSALNGYWNEQLKSHEAFVTALKHLVQANILGMEEILAVRPDAIFIQSETSEHYHPVLPEAVEAANFHNEHRFLSLDLNFGRPPAAGMYQYLLDNGLSRDEFRWFARAERLKPRCVVGNDYYHASEKWARADGSRHIAGEVLGYSEITRQYFERYGIPVMHTETNFPEGEKGDEAVVWLARQWANVVRVRDSGAPIVGFTWYSITDQVDWDNNLREDRGVVNPLGLYDLDRNIRPVGRAYKEMVQAWRELLPVHSNVLTMPIAGA